MTTPLILSRPNGTPITNWEMWTRPKRDYHWECGRSAMELAKAWFRKSEMAPPDELLQLLHSSDRLKNLHLLKGIPELVTPLPGGGGGCNHDLWLLGHTNQEKVTICIEAKADEPFGNKTIAQYRLSANKQRESGKSTRVPERITKLLSLVPAAENRWDNVRYQLLTAICGTATRARKDGSVLAVFVVHEFHTSKTTEDKIRANEKDFNTFMTVITGSHEPFVKGMLYGPVIVGGMDCLIGRAVS